MNLLEAMAAMLQGKVMTCGEEHFHRISQDDGMAYLWNFEIERSVLTPGGRWSIAAGQWRQDHFYALPLEGWTEASEQDLKEIGL